MSTEFERRVERRLAEWNRCYEAAGVECASPLMDRVLAEQEIAAEIESELLPGDLVLSPEAAEDFYEDAWVSKRIKK